MLFSLHGDWVSIAIDLFQERMSITVHDAVVRRVCYKEIEMAA